MKALLLAFFLACVCFINGGTVDMTTFPTAFTQYNRIMGFILSFSYDHIDPLTLIFNEYVSMCEGGWDPTIVIFTTSNWTDTMFRYVRQKTYCYRTGRSVPVKLDVYAKDVGTGLAMYHKPYLKKEINNFDFFVYHEDDIMFKHSHLVAYLHETKKLNDLLPDDGLHDHVIGFQRYRRLLRGGDIHTPYGEGDIFEQELLEEVPSFSAVCINDEPYLHVTGNLHQAIWAFTTIQLRMLQTKCNFMDHMNPSREFMSSFLVFEHKPAHCGMNKLIPADRLQTFSIWHYYQQRHVSWSSVFYTDENLRAGYLPYNPGSDANAPACWHPLIDRTRKEMAVPTAPSRRTRT